MVLGTTNCGIVGYNCNYKNNADKTNYDGSHFIDRVFMGSKWQCVEFARRFWLTRKNLIIPPLGFASHIWDLDFVAERSSYNKIPIVKYPNGGTEAPAAGDLLIYKSTPNQWVGHVAVVLDFVSCEDGTHLIRVGEQNNDNDEMWKYGTHADELLVEVTRSGDLMEQTFTVTNSDPDLQLSGWVRAYPEQSTPRVAWTLPEAPLADVDGIYSVETTKTLQRFLSAKADGSHGGFTNTSIRNLLREIGNPEDDVASLSAEDLIISLRKFLVRKWSICGDVEEAVPESLPACYRTDCVCYAVMSVGKGVNKENSECSASEVIDSSACCRTTCALQRFLNRVQHPHDIPSALATLSQA